MLLKSEMFSLDLHHSLFAGLAREADLHTSGSLTHDDAERLDAWADDCANPIGQKADLARAIAGLIRVAGTLKIEHARVEAGFWDRVG